MTHDERSAATRYRINPKPPELVQNGGCNDHG
jgi:hypothetical protein